MSLISKSHLLIVSGPSGGGKSTFCSRILKDIPSLSLSISSTTRTPRKQEKNGEDYIFISKDQFLKSIEENQFAEWAVVHGNYYGTLKKTIETAFLRQQSLLLDLDIQGSRSLKKLYGPSCFRVFITPPNLQELEKRLRNRGTDSESDIQKRLLQSEEELAVQSEFDITIVNDSLNESYEKFKSLCLSILSVV